MTADTQVAPNNHPSPQRGKVGLGALWFGICGVPFAWIGLEIFSYVVTTGICGEKSVTAMDMVSATISAWHILLPTSLVAAALGLITVYVALHNWRESRYEKPGSAHHLIEVGEGRTRFLAMFGLLTSIGFMITFIFSATTLIVVPLCK
jgi:hypothetical protein